MTNKTFLNIIRIGSLIVGLTMWWVGCNLGDILPYVFIFILSMWLKGEDT